MCKPVLVSIPVRKHTKQFLLQEFALANDEVIYMHQNNFIGKTVLLGLEKHPYRQNKPKEPAPHKSELLIALPKALKHQVLTPKSRKDLGEFFDKYFQQCLIFFIKGQLAITGNELHAITMFIENYQIDADSYDLETARKCWRDYKDRILRLNQSVAAAAA